jgi:hypothetical protein
LDCHSDEIAVHGIPDTIRTARLLHDSTPVEMERRGDETILFVPEERCDPFDTVIVFM